MAAVTVAKNLETVNAFEQEGKVGTRLRKLSGTLPKLDIPNDNHKNPFFDKLFSPKISEEETREEGRALLGKFIFEEFDKEKIETPLEIRAEFDNLCSPKGYKHRYWAKAGSELRRCADEFQKSKERGKVRQKAYEVTRDSDSISEDLFHALLSALLPDGITKERIVVLFFFCADVAIATLKKSATQGVDLCRQFVRWSLDFIMDRVCTWVQEHGGWGVVFRSTMAVVMKVAAAGFIVVACFYGFKRLARGAVTDIGSNAV